MGLSGSLDTLALSEVLQTLGRTQATGVLSISSPHGGRDLYFHGGAVVLVQGRGEDWSRSLALRLAALGLISAEEVEGLAQLTGFELLVSLVGTSDLVRQGLHGLMTDEISDLFTWTGAYFRFREAALSSGGLAASISQAVQLGFHMDVVHLVMDSARRLDEWNRIRQQLPRDDHIVVPTGNRLAELAEATSDFPASALIPFFNGHHSYREVVDLAPISHIDAGLITCELLQRGLLQVADGQQMVEQARRAANNGDLAAACLLLHHRLNLDGPDPTLTDELDHLLAALKTQDPQTGRCWTSLAKARLAQGDPVRALGAARQGASLWPGGQSKMVEIACLVANGRKEEAVSGLRVLAERFQAEGRLDEARSVCQKILQFDPNDSGARRRLGAIEATTQASGGVEEVLCVACGTANPRAAQTCSHCKASLQLTCRSCGRQVAILDQVCVFCGANPHEQPDPVDNPQMTKALELESGRKWTEALTLWKELARDPGAHPDLLVRIRHLEGLIHDEKVDQMAQRGERLRASRNYWRAARCFRAALQALANDDPRHAPLQQLERHASKVHRQTAGLQATAFAILGLTAWLGLAPGMALRDYHNRIDKATDQIEAALRQPDPVAAWQAIKVIPARPDLSPRTYGKEGRQQHRGLESLHRRTGEVLAGKALDQLEAALDRQDLSEAERILAQTQAAFSGLVGDRLTRAEQRLAGLKQARASAHQDATAAEASLTAAENLETSGKPGAALAAFQTLCSSTHAPVANRARNKVEELLRRQAEIRKDLEEAKASASRDAAAAARRLAGLRQPAEAWGLERPWQTATDHLAEAARQAQAAWAALGNEPSLEALTGFLKAHPGAIEAQEAVRRQADLLGSRARFNDILQTYRQAVSKGNLQQAWQAASTLFTFPAAWREAQVLLPAQLNLGRAGVAVTLDSRPLGSTDAEGRLLFWREPQASGRLRCTLEGFQPLDLDQTRFDTGPAVTAHLDRLQLWQAEYKSPDPCTALALHGKDLFLLTPSRLFRFDGQGHEMWSVDRGVEAVGSGSEGPETGLPVPLDGNRFLATGRDGALLLLDLQGQATRIATPQPCRHQPVVFTSDLTAEARVVLTSTHLHVGPPGGPFTRITLDDTVTGPPAVVTVGLDRLLLVPTGKGPLVAIDGATLEIRWRLPLPSADPGRPLAFGPGQALTVLDATRLAWIDCNPSPRLLRQLPLEGDLLGQPLVLGEGLLWTLSQRVMRLPRSGGTATPLPLPGPPLLPAAGCGQLTATVCTVQNQPCLSICDQASERWRQTLAQPAVALAIGPAIIIIASAGRLVAYTP